MFLRDDPEYGLAGMQGPRGLRMPSSASTPSPRVPLRTAATSIDWVPDLGAQIGSLDW